MNRFSFNFRRAVNFLARATGKLFGSSRARLVWVVVLALAPLCARDARAFVVTLNDSGQPLRWNFTSSDPSLVDTNIVNPKTKAVRLYFAADAYSTTNTAAELNALRASFGQWQSISGTVIKFEEGGLMGPGADVNVMDNTNVIFWAKTSTLVNGGLDNISGALAVTFKSWYDGTLLLAEADMAINGVDSQWFTDFNDTANPNYFIEATVCHEIGHFLGLLHSPVGGATMLYHGGSGISVQAGLSSDEIAAARYLYPQPGLLSTLGQVQGKVTMNGAGILGAAVYAEDPTGAIVSGTVTQTNGQYALPALPPGSYRVRVTPLDPFSNISTLLQGLNISPDYETAEGGFIPSTNHSVTLAPGASVTWNVAVTKGTPAFRITRIRPPSTDPNHFVLTQLPGDIALGAANLIIGVYSPSFPATGATLTVSGDGLTVGPTVFNGNPFPGSGYTLLSASISVASNATPGLRSLVVTQGTNIAYANGFLKIRTAFPDYNFDGLDDRFQRQYFSVFTSAAAAPGAYPDGDGFNNAQEFLAGSDPTDPKSVLKLESVTLNSSGSTIAWLSGTGKRYQVMSRDDIAKSPWRTNAIVTGTGALTQYTDASATNNFRLYRVQAIP